MKGKVNSNERMASQIAKRGITTVSANMSAVQNAATAGHGGKFDRKYDCIILTERIVCVWQEYCLLEYVRVLKIFNSIIESQFDQPSLHV